MLETEENKSLPAKQITVEVVQASFKSLRETNKKKFKADIAKSIEEHPFVEITDNETYKRAKENRTALKTVRTTINSGDKVLASAFSSERKEQIKDKDELIGEVQPHEDKQQKELDRWEQVKKEAKEAKAKAEQERQDVIKNKIQELKKAGELLLKNCNFETIEITEAELEKLFKTDYDFEEFEILIDTIKEESNQNFKDTVANLKDAEEKRIQSVKDNQKAKFNECKLYALEAIDEATTKDLNLVETVTKYFDGLEFDFGDYLNEVIELKGKTIEKAGKRLKELEEQSKKDNELAKLQEEKKQRENKEKAEIEALDKKKKEQKEKKQKQKLEKQKTERVERLKEDKNNLNVFIDKIHETFNTTGVGADYQPETIKFMETLSSEFEAWIKDSRDAISEY